MARCLGCPATKVTDHGELIAALDAAMPALAQRQGPLLIEVAVRA
jgi:benzoylformate decarboxylase